MALPELLLPSGIPNFLLSGHAVARESPHDDFDVMAGHPRKRKIWTEARRTVTVSLDLSEDQAADLDEWFENVLIVGNEKFTARIAPVGDAAKYWEAQWVAPPLWTPRADVIRDPVTGGKVSAPRWRVDGQLLLTGDGSDEKPGTTTLAVEYVVALVGTAAIDSAATLAVEYSVALLASDPLAVEYDIALVYAPPSYSLREATGYRMRQGGGRRKRQGT